MPANGRLVALSHPAGNPGNRFTDPAGGGPMSTLEEVFTECLELISKRAENGFRFSDIGDLFSDCDPYFLSHFLSMVADGKDHEKLHQEVAVSMTLRDLITLADGLDELKQLRAFSDTYDEAVAAYLSSKERQEKRLAKFAADVSLTFGRRRPRFNEFGIFRDYLGAIRGTGPELNGKKLSKQAALELVANKHGIQSAEAVVSHLKRFLKKTGDKFPGILP
jgi:hypothetical protein